MGFAENARQSDEERAVAKLEHRVADVRRERDQARAALRSTAAENAELRQLLDLASELDQRAVSIPKWAKQRRVAKGKHQATALLMLSDLHFDEIEKPEELNFANAYNRTIALQRLERVTSGAVNMATHLLGGFTYDGAVVLLGGDCFGGIIHEELKDTAEAHLVDSVDFWVDPLAGALEAIASTFGKVLVIGVVGNHGRLDRKPRTKGRVRSNVDWLLYRMLRRHFRNDSRFEWNIPDSPDAHFEVYGHRHVLTHGDQARGGSGISGILTPLSLLDHRKRKRDTAIGLGWSHMWLGHFHQYLRTGAYTVNGSTKGLDSYAILQNFSYEEPSQAFAVLTPEHNVTIESAIYCMDRKAEGW